MRVQVTIVIDAAQMPRANARNYFIEQYGNTDHVDFDASGPDDLVGEVVEDILNAELADGKWWHGMPWAISHVTAVKVGD